MTERTFIAVAPADAVPEGSVHKVDMAGTSVLLCHTQGRIFAVRNKCSHADEELACGRMRSGWISCPAHGARFRLESGEPMNPPATEPIVTYDVRVENGMIEVAL